MIFILLLLVVGGIIVAKSTSNPETKETATKVANTSGKILGVCFVILIIAVAVLASTY